MAYVIEKGDHMRNAWRGLIGLAALFILSGALFPWLGGTRFLRLDASSLFSPPPEVLEGPEESELDRQCKAVMQCMAAKDALVPDIIARRLSLRDAAKRFGEIDQQNPRFQQAAYRRTYEGRSDLERSCRAVISRVRVSLEDQPDLAEVIGQRLGTELLEQFPPEGPFPPQEK
jgi:hypothetical protein